MMCGRRADAADPLSARSLRRIVWTAPVGERISRLWVGAMPGREGEVLLAGTNSGGVLAFDPESGEPLGRCAPTGSPVLCFVASQDGILAAHADGTMQTVRAGR